MSDDPTLPEGNSGEAASAAEGSPPPWGDDFNPERAWRTIEHLRGRERELESDAKAYKRLQEDEDALREYLAQKGYEIADEDTEEIPDYDEEVEEDFDEEDPYDKRISAIEQQVQAREQQAQEERANQEFVAHVLELAGDTEISERDVLWIHNQSKANGFNHKATEEAFETLKEIRQQAIEEYRQSKRAPHFSSSGQSATKAPNLDDAQARQQWMQERVASLEQDR